MKGFEENNCRLCEKVFCCKKCREQHEKTKHDIFPGCDICIYGKVQLSSASPGLVEHVKRKHWPLHCLICKRLFGSVDELFQHSKCPILHIRITNESQKSPYKPVVENPCHSPRLSSSNFHRKRHQSNKKTTSNLATSTPMSPMQRADNNLWEKIHEIIFTPEYYYSVSNKNRIIKKTPSDSNQCDTLSKRRVTFGETPLVDSHNTKISMAMMATGADSSEYYSTKQERTQDTVESKILENDIQNVPLIKITDASDVKEDNGKDGQEKNEENNVPDQSEEDNTVWMSAINTSAANIDENGSLPYQNKDPAQFATPFLPNYKKKQINIVMPSPITKKETSIKFHGAVQISSTPNCSVIPVKSAPKHRDIFRCEESLPSSLDSNSGSVQVRTNNQNDIENSRNVSELSEDCRGIVTELSHENSDISMHSRLWTSVSRIVKNVTDAIQSFSSVEGITPNSTRSLKRHSADDDFMEAGPYIKRYKLTEIRCRRTIRELSPIERFLYPYLSQESNEIHLHAERTFVDKSTQTDESIFIL